MLSLGLLQVRKSTQAAVLSVLLVGFAVISPAEVPETAIRLEPLQSVILVDAAEPSYVQYAANDLASYLKQISKASVAISGKPSTVRNKTVIVVGRAMAHQLGQEVVLSADLGPEGYVIRSVQGNGTTQIMVAGHDPHGTNAGVAALMQMIRAEGAVPYLDGRLDVRSKPSYAMRGIHLNGWPLNY